MRYPRYSPIRRIADLFLIFQSSAQHNHVMNRADSDTQRVFAHRLRLLRNDRKLRQEDVAKAVNISSRTYSNYERAYRMPDLRILSSLADYYNVSTDFLLGRTNLIYRYPMDVKSLRKLLSEGADLLQVAEGQINAKDLYRKEDDGNKGKDAKP